MSQIPLESSEYHVYNNNKNNNKNNNSNNNNNSYNNYDKVTQFKFRNMRP